MGRLGMLNERLEESYDTHPILGVALVYGVCFALFSLLVSGPDVHPWFLALGPALVAALGPAFRRRRARRR
jgi:hypothetical protein